MNVPYPPVRRRPRVLPCLLGASCLLRAAALVAADEAPGPDPALLEFLGDWQAAAGGDVDPAMLADDPPPAGGTQVETPRDEE